MLGLGKQLGRWPYIQGIFWLKNFSRVTWKEKEAVCIYIYICDPMTRAVCMSSLVHR